MKKIVIIGSGGCAKEVAYLIDSINNEKKKWEVLGFIDSNIDDYNGKYKVVNNDNWLMSIDYKIYVAFGIGDPILIHKLHNKFMHNKFIEYPNLIHPKVLGDWERVEFGYGNIVAAGVNFTTDIIIGSFNIFNTNCTIAHDTVIGNYNVFNPSVNLSGGLIIENEIFVGTGVQVLQYRKIVSNVKVGAGAVVTKDLLEEGTYVGIPARKVESK